MSCKKRIFALIMSGLIISAFSGCSSQTDAGKSSSSASSDTQEAQTINDDMFTSRDMKTDYDADNATKITLADNNIKSSSNNVAISDNTVTLSEEGTYIISGKLSEGQIIIDAQNTDKLQIVLDNAEISNSTTAPIYVKQADKVFVTLSSASKNTLSNNGAFTADGDTNVDAVIFSKDDLTLNGKGTLDISTSCGHGIVSKDDLVITSGTYNISSSGHAISGKDSVRIADGAYKFTAQKDGIHSENTDDTTLGFIYVIGGSFDIESDGDGFDSSAYTQLKGGSINIAAGGGTANATVKRDEFAGFYGGYDNQYSDDESSISTKGIKASGELTISGATVTIDSADDALHSNSDITINNGNINLKTGDDGIHADNNVVISEGTIDITQSYEGIEGTEIEIKGGTINIVSSDDGLNAAGGNDESGFNGGMQRDNFMSSGNGKLTISGGKINVVADGDGLDSNGSLYVSGGEIYISGSENGGNGALDYDSDAEITGGIIIAAGNSGMAQNFGDNSTQGSILYNSMSNGNGDVILKDSSGKELAKFTPEKSYNSVVVSCPDIKQGETYTLTMSGEEYTVEMTSLIYGSSNGMGDHGNMGGGFNGGMGHQLGF